MPQTPRQTPANSGPVDACDKVHIDQAYIGACVGAKLGDLHMVAEVLKALREAREHFVVVIVGAPAVVKRRKDFKDGALA